MKRTIILLVAAVAAAITLTASVSASESAQWQGTVTFESSAMPALNFTVPLKRVADVYPLVPDNICGICSGEYETVRKKCDSSSRFTHEGVRIRKIQDDGTTVTLEFALSGYKVTVKDALWENLDQIFIGANGQD
jgi:hypothetical protein